MAALLAPYPQSEIPTPYATPTYRTAINASLGNKLNHVLLRAGDVYENFSDGGAAGPASGIVIVWEYS
jgi:hypothetical protein